LFPTVLRRLQGHQPEPKPEAAPAALIPATGPEGKGKLWKKLFGSAKK
jgi:hypothetical protein